MVFDRNAPMSLAVAALESRKGLGVELVLRVVLNEPINDDGCMEYWLNRGSFIGCLSMMLFAMYGAT